MTEEYDKLVRDRIPEIVRENGEKPVTRTVSGEEYREYLHAKLDEEVAEVHDDPTVEELADVQAVVRALATAQGIEPQELDRVRDQKAEKRGAFEEGIVLEAVRR